MADIKKYLDLVGLTHYDEKIKAYIKTNGSDVTDKLVALIGAAEKGEDEATILARVAALETAVGDVSELDSEVKNLVKAIIGESVRAKGVEEDLQDAIDALDEKLYGSDEESEGESVHTKGDIDKIQDRLTALEEDTSDADAVAALEEKLYGKGEGEEHIDGDLDKINAAIAAEQERAEGAEEDILDFVGELPEDAEAETVVGYAEEIVAAEEAARKAQIGELGKVSEEEGAADHTVKSYVDAAVEAINGDADALEDRVEALEATHAKKTVGEGDAAKEVFKTVAEEVNEAVTDLIDGAPDALDTLKEIADWIANQDESGVTDAATLVARVEANAQAIADEQERAEGAESDLQDNIDAVEEKVDAFTAITNAEIDKLFGEEVEEEPGVEETP